MGASLNITEAIKKGDKIKFVGDMATNPFQLQGKCASAKASLTKALTALEKTSLGFDRLTQEEELLTKQRYARTFMKALEKVETKKADLETCFENLIEHVHGMAHTCQERIAVWVGFRQCSGKDGNPAQVLFV